MTQKPIITVSVASRILAQGELVADHGDGTATVDTGGKRSTGKIVHRMQNVGSQPAKRLGEKRLTLALDGETYKRLRLHAAETGQTHQAILESALLAALRNHDPQG